MAGNNAIGTGALVLSVNADNLFAGLNKVEKAAQKSQANVQKGFGGGLTDAFAGGFGGAAFGGVAVAKLTEFGGAIWDTIKGTERLKEETDRLARSQAELAAGFDRSMKRADEFLGAITDPKQRGAELDKQIAASEKMLAASRAEEEAFRKRGTALAETFSGASIGKRLTGTLDAERERAVGSLKDVEARVDKLSGRLAELREQRTRALDPTRNPELLKEINTLTDSLKAQRDTLGMTGAQAQIYALKMKGATTAQLEQAQKIADELDALDKKAKQAAGPKLAGAFQQGSAEAYSVVAKFQTGGMVQAAERKQVEELQKANVNLGRIATTLAKAPILKSI